MPEKRLGRGLEALIRPAEDEKKTSRPGVAAILINAILSNPHQPRQQFDETALEELTASIKEKGVLTPITVRMEAGQFILIAGERRLRAAQRAGLKEIPAYILKITDEADMVEMALIENIQRENLNPIEEAEAYAFLNSKFDLSQEKIAQAVGKKRVTVTNSLRLLTLPAEVRDSLRDGDLSAGHGRAILMMKTTRARLKLWKQIIEKSLSVRAAEAFAQLSAASKPILKIKESNKSTNPQIRVLENELISILGTKVKIKSGKENGAIEISYYSQDDLDRILELLRSIQD